MTTSSRHANPLMLGLLALLAAACASPGRDLRLDGEKMPPDFAIEFMVTGNPASDDPLSQTAYYVVEAQSPLTHRRRAAGRGASLPSSDACPAPEEMESLFQIIHTHCLLRSSPSSPGAKAYLAGKKDGAVLYEVVIASHGGTFRYVTTPAESPGSAQLLESLAELRAGRSSLEPAAPGASPRRNPGKHRHE